jgi:hypothetical protein
MSKLESHKLTPYYHFKKGKMRKISTILILLFIVSFYAGCSTKSSFNQIYGQPTISSTSKFKIGEIYDHTGYINNPENDEKPINIPKAMNDALQTVLTNSGLIADDAPWIISVDILSYSPGSASARWLVIGAGETKLSVVAAILSPEGLKAANINIERSISFGGGRAIGAWKYVFDEVAAEMVAILTDPNRRASR